MFPFWLWASVFFVFHSFTLINVASHAEVTNGDRAANGLQPDLFDGLQVDAEIEHLLYIQFHGAILAAPSCRKDRPLARTVIVVDRLLFARMNQLCLRS